MIESEKQTPASADVSDRTSEYYWRYVLAHRRAEHVRRSDGQVVESRIMTRDEIERALRTQSANRGPGVEAAEETMLAVDKSQNKQEGTMRGKAQERVENLIGTKPGKGNIEILEIVGQHPVNNGFLVKAKCACGRILPKIMVSDITTGRKEYCDRRICPIAQAAKGERRTAGAARSGARRTSTAKRPYQRAKKNIAAGSNGDGRDGSVLGSTFSPTQATAVSGTPLSLLADEAAMLRRAAVGILAGSRSPEEIADAMRRQADKLDELIYAQ